MAVMITIVEVIIKMMIITIMMIMMVVMGKRGILITDTMITDWF